MNFKRGINPREALNLGEAPRIIKVLEGFMGDDEFEEEIRFKRFILFRSKIPGEDVYSMVIIFQSYTRRKFISGLKNFLKENNLWIYFERYWSEKIVKRRELGPNVLEVEIPTQYHKIWDSVYFHFIPEKANKGKLI